LRPPHSGNLKCLRVLNKRTISIIFPNFRKNLLNMPGAKPTIDENVYETMLDYMHGLAAGERHGGPKDAAFINDDFWLQDTAVIENIECRKGEWNVYLVFAHHLQPLKFIKRKIVHFVCPKRAALAAHYMRRLAAKDQRGTLAVSHAQINQQYN
jgi:hypothetical protein